MLLFTKTGCKNSKDKNSEINYFSGKQQSAETKVVDSLKPENKLKLSNLGIYRPGDIDSYRNYLFISDIKDRKVYKLKKTSLTVVDTIGSGRGQGPGEAERLKSIDVANGEVIVPDVRGRKIMIFDTDGRLKKSINTKTFPPKKVELVNNKTIVVSTDARPSVSKFIVIDRKGNILNEFVNIEESENPLKYNDDILATGKSIYVLGSPEPLLRRFNMDGELIYSRYTINKIPTLYNYEKSRLGDDRVSYSYSRNALYSSYCITNGYDHLYVAPVHNEDGTVRELIDVYEHENGDYLYSLSTSGNVTNLTQENDAYLYAIESIDEEKFLIEYNINNLD
jgi:hypothetical protein